MMRRFINIVENAQGVAAEFQGVELPRIILKAGTILYHGTSRPMEEWNPHEEAPFSPAWFGLEYGIAASYARYARGDLGGAPMVLEYRLDRDLSLLEASGSEISEIMDRLYDEWMTDEIAEGVLAMGFEGWHIKGNEVMIGDTEALTFIKAEEARR